MADTKLNVYQKLAKARIELQNKNLKKTGKNSFAHYDYYQLQDFIPSLNVIFSELGLIGLFNIKAEMNDLNNGVATLVIKDTESNEEIVFESPIADADLKGCTRIQSLGGIHTYMKRYLYQNALEITESDMLDSATGSEKFNPEHKKTKPNVKNDDLTPIRQEQYLWMVDNMTEKLIAYTCQKFNVGDLTELTSAQADFVINSIQKKKEKENA